MHIIWQNSTDLFLSWNQRRTGSETFYERNFQMFRRFIRNIKYLFLRTKHIHLLKEENTALTRALIESIDLVANAINSKENICILGDYDVDGSAATSLFVRYFKSINHPFFFYIPDREKDGYGASKKLFQKLFIKKPKLVIMVDCGSTSNEAVEFLNENNIKSLIIDHHEINKPYPKADVIINPKIDNGYIEYNYLCATALVYFFLDLLSKKIKSQIKKRI